jgi:hypothetical protein
MKMKKMKIKVKYLESTQSLERATTISCRLKEEMAEAECFSTMTAT